MIVIVDLFSRPVVGRSMSATMTLVKDCKSRVPYQESAIGASSPFDCHSEGPVSGLERPFAVGATCPIILTYRQAFIFSNEVRLPCLLE